ncbi:histone deacetylase family protein [Amylibacter sp.]|nr:histone deacetylase family protein [Amylibacter sp.]
MKTAYLTHSDYDLHLTPAGHPEQVDRLSVINERLSKPEFNDLHKLTSPMGTNEQVTLCHPESYVNYIKNSCPSEGSIALDGDTHVSTESSNSAMRAVGAVCEAVDLVLNGKAKNAFCASRPPGHHAEKSKPMGFCLFGTIAIAAKYAMKTHRLSRVAIIDFDVHHGNGTQDLVWDDPNIMFISSQQMPLWPGTGFENETGAFNNIINYPLKPEMDGQDLINAYKKEILEKVSEFKPEMLFISAGFDAHKNDPLANLNFSTDDFRIITKLLCEFADNYCKGRVVSTLEGGYDLPSLAECVAAHVKVLMEHAK